MGGRANSVLLVSALKWIGEARVPFQVTMGSILPCNLLNYQDLYHLTLVVCPTLHRVQIFIFFSTQNNSKVGSTVGLL